MVTSKRLEGDAPVAVTKESDDDRDDRGDVDGIGSNGGGIVDFIN